MAQLIDMHIEETLNIEVGTHAAAWSRAESQGSPEAREWFISMQAWLTVNPEGPHQRELRAAIDSA